jgi:hypothetical protein
MAKVLQTWSGKSNFRYSGSVAQGTDIDYGGGLSFKARIGVQAYSALLRTFSGRETPIGTSRTAPPEGSLGAWLKANVSKTALASYVGPILIEEGYAYRGSRPDTIKFRKLA